MTFDKDGIWRDEQWALPNRIGPDVGGAQERAMQSVVGGYQGIMTVEFQNHDGSITTLRNRNGWPEIETRDGLIPAVPPENIDYDLGFVAWTGSRAMLFNPYTLAELDANYRLAGKLYAVQDFETDWNRPITPNYDWFDVALFDGTKVRINAKWMEDLSTSVAGFFPSIPYIINRDLALDQYGDAVRNSYEKRVFEVGRYAVYSHNAVTETLAPSAAREDNKAVTIGQRLDYSVDKAFLGQIYYTGASWDSLYGTWAASEMAVTMTLSLPYLAATQSSPGVMAPAPALSDQGYTSGQFTPRSIPLPSTAVAIIGDGEVSHYASWPSDTYGRVNFPWASAFNSTMDGEQYGSHQSQNFGGSGGGSAVQSGVTLTMAANNTWTQRLEYQTSRVPTQFVQLVGDHVNLMGDNTLGYSGSNLIWGTTFLAPAIKGKGNRQVIGHDIAGSAVQPVYKEQDGSLSISGGAIAPFFMSFSLRRVTGQQVTYQSNLQFYDNYLADPYGTIGDSYGIGVGQYNNLFLGNLANYKKPSGQPQPQSAIDEINAEINGKLDLLGATQFCNYEPGTRSNFYSVSKSSDVTGSMSLEWNTEDYLFYDRENEVKIYVRGEFSGAQTIGTPAAAVLTVSLYVETRHAVNVIVLHQANYQYTDLLLEHTIPGQPYTAVRSPVVFAVFAPLCQEQGSFKGAHYVTKAEEANGAVPVHLFNFALNLHTFSDFGDIDEMNEQQAGVHFVPFNLLQALYATVFSQEMGGNTINRYPVTFATRYNDMVSTLFSTPFHIAVRDGVEARWADAFGPDFVAIDTVSLYRT